MTDNNDFKFDDLDIDIPDINLDEIETIVDSGTRKKESFISFLKNSVRNIGIDNIFHDRKELLIIGSICFIVMNIIMGQFLNQKVGYGVYIFLFVGAPLIYLSLNAFSFYSSIEEGVYEIEMTCKHDLYQLTVFRMFFFSAINIILNTVMISGFGLFNKGISVLRLTLISTMGVLIFSILFLYSLRTFKRKYAKYIILGLWFLVNIFLGNMENEIYRNILIDGSIMIHIIVCVICLFIYVKSLQSLLVSRKKERE